MEAVVLTQGKEGVDVLDWCLYASVHTRGWTHEYAHVHPFTLRRAYLGTRAGSSATDYMTLGYGWEQKHEVAQTVFKSTSDVRLNSKCIYGFAECLAA